MSIRSLLVAAFAATVLSPAVVHAQAWPSKPIRLISPFPAGGSADLLSRKLGQQLGAALGQPVLVENVPGAMGSIGLARMVRGPADGYTIALGANSTQAMAPFMIKLPYDPLADFQPLGGMTTYAFTLVVHPSEPSKTVAELVARSKTVPGGVSFGSVGPGSGSYLFGEMLRLQAGFNLNHVPYKGTAPALNDLMAGHISSMFDIVGSSAPAVKAGKLRALGVSSKTRSRLLPDVPAIAESIPGFEGVGWFAFFGPRGLPPEVTQRLNAEIDKVYRSPEFVAFLDQAGYDYVASTPEQLGDTIQKDYALWGRVMKAAGIKPE